MQAEMRLDNKMTQDEEPGSVETRDDSKLGDEVTHKEDRPKGELWMPQKRTLGSLACPKARLSKDDNGSDRSMKSVSLEGRFARTRKL